MRAVSVLPPKKPETMPIVPPMSADIAPAQKPISSEIRAPAMSRSSMFAPPPSVPSGHSLLGGAKTGPTFAFGSSPTISGLKIARKTKTARMPTATIADLFRRTGAAIARHLSERVGDGASSACGAPVWTGLTRSLLHPRVESEVEEVGEQVEEDHRQREQEECRLQHRIVALVDRLDDEESDARVREDVLDGDRAADDEPERQRDERDDREHRVAEPVLPHRRPVREPLRPRGEDVVLAERLEHRRANDERVLTKDDEAERERGKDHVLEPVHEHLDEPWIAEDAERRVLHAGRG